MHFVTLPRAGPGLPREATAGVAALGTEPDPQGGPAPCSPPQVGNLGLLFMLLFFIYAALGVELFGKLGE